MPRSDEAQAFFHAVYAAVQEIPYAKVTSYGHIAMLVGTRNALLSMAAQRPRQVGVCMKHLPADPAARFNSETVPWQRVINAKGVISPSSEQSRGSPLTLRRSQPSGARSQAAALRAEGVEVTTGALGELMVDFAEYGWFPRALPSEGGGEGDSIRSGDGDGSEGG
ncbi:DNA binding methylated-DNA--cysteine S-methyltransferase [Tolypocladium paradoxum]|uniref:DNA binding methylated-DNA--cysteine S-methyltransferase n=1 Tax=Tolypocladium paradoxum TaxID=94208 RepID=A0A2S4KQQ6_9HYPO|nr:DNA binding methylated-DNA--cysteine S-methyltransferase [Tolypocladium paradoxum]